jgi:hypothetical protein
MSDDKNFEELENDSGLISEFWQFLKTNKKFWLLPILFIMLLLGVLLILGSTGAAPFIYTLF